MGTYFVAALLVLLFCSSLGSVHALDASETTALAEMLRVWPHLAHVSPFDQFTASTTPYVDRGGSWNSVFGNWCSQGDGYEYHGGVCQGGNVTALLFTTAWGPPTDSNFSFLTGLTHLKNITMEANLDLYPQQEILLAVIPGSSLESLDLGANYGSSVWTQISLLSSLRYLRGALPATLDFSGLSSLTHLFQITTLLRQYEIWHLSETLEHLEVPLDFTNDTQVSWMSSFTALKVWKCPYCRFPSNTVNLVLPPSLVHLGLQSIDPIFSTLNIDISSSDNAIESIEMRELFNWTPNMTQNVTSNLKRLFQSYIDEPSQIIPLDNMVKLESLDLQFGSLFDWIFPSLASLTQLKHLGIHSIANISEQTISPTICEVADHLESLSLGNTFIISETFYRLPSCLRYDPNVGDGKTIEKANPTLKKVRLGANYAGYLDPNFFENLPSSIIYMDISESMSPETFFNASQLSRFVSLEYFNAGTNWMTGSLPPDFLLMLPHLKYLNLESNSLNGTIPWQGYEILEELRLNFNQFQEWPNIIGSASKLTYLSVSDNLLLSMPPDDAFLSMTSLSTFDIGYNFDLDGPVPHFWANLPVIRNVSLRNCAFEGAMPEYIYSPQLWNLDFRFNQICGDLPKNVTSNFVGSDNQLMGSIPSEWATSQMPIFDLFLNGNQLNGTLPDGLISLNSGHRLSFLGLANNYFSGPVCNLSQVAIADGVQFQQNQFDLCAQGPELPNFITCSIDDDYCGCETLWSFCSGKPSASCVPQAAAPPDFVPTAPSIIFPNATCATPPARIVSPEFATPIACPPLPPGFKCKEDGTVFAPGPISGPTLSIPNGLGTVPINGSVTVDTGITFEGLGTQLHINGCLQAPDGITFELTETQTSDPVQLITQNENCPFALSDLALKVNEPKSCKKTKIKTDGSTRSSLTVAFVIDSSQCNVKWIILGSVLGGVIVLAAVGVILAYKFNPRVRLFFTPYKGSRM